MKLQLAHYSTITEHFTRLTNSHCEFVQDLKTLYLKVNGSVYKASRFAPEIEKNSSVDELIELYISILEDKLHSNA